MICGCRKLRDHGVPEDGCRVPQDCLRTQLLLAHKASIARLVWSVCPLNEQASHCTCLHMRRVRSSLQKRRRRAQSRGSSGSWPGLISIHTGSALSSSYKYLPPMIFAKPSNLLPTFYRGITFRYQFIVIAVPYLSDRANE